MLGVFPPNSSRSESLKNNDMLDLSVIILTYNEEIHIRRCLENIIPLAKSVFIIDCYSTDKTIEIAQSYENVTVLQHKWVNYATRFRSYQPLAAPMPRPPSKPLAWSWAPL